MGDVEVVIRPLLEPAVKLWIMPVTDFLRKQIRTSSKPEEVIWGQKNR